MGAPTMDILEFLLTVAEFSSMNPHITVTN